MKSNEILKIIGKQWCSTKDLMIIGKIGRNKAIKIKKIIKTDLENQGYIMPNNDIPMKEVIDKLHIDISYLKSFYKNE